MAISAEVTKTRILLNISGVSGPLILQRARASNRVWLTFCDGGYCLLPHDDIEPKLIEAGDFLDSYELEGDLYEYRYVSAEIENPESKDYTYSKWVKFGDTGKIGYSFNNYSAPQGQWGSILTPDDCRYTYLWGTDFKATNGEFFSDEQIQWFIDEAVRYMERQLNITIKKRVIKSCENIDGLKQTNKYSAGDYDDEESLYDFKYSKIQRYGMINTKQRPILKLDKLELINRGSKNDLTKSVTLDKKKGIIKFLDRPYKTSNTWNGISTAMDRYGMETYNSHLFYAIDYVAGYESSDYVPEDLRQMIGKVAAISLLNIIGDGLMSGFSSSSLSMDGISESFSSTQSATSAYFGARISVYKDDVKNYIESNKYKFGFMPIGAL